MAVRAVMLDLGNVIIPLDFTRCHAMLQKTGSGLSFEDVIGRIQSSGIVERFERGEISPDEFCRKVCTLLNLEIESAAFWDIWNAMYAATPAIPDALLSGLRRNRRLLLLSNTNPIHFEMVRRRYSFLRHFDDCIVSFEVGVMKPDSRIYEAALARAGCSPEECFFVDDLLPFVAGAKKHGIDAVQFHSLEQLQDEFRSRGVDW